MHWRDSRSSAAGIPRNFEPMRKQVETWQRSELTDVTAKVVIYEALYAVNANRDAVDERE